MSSHQPSRSEVHINAALTNVSVAYDQEATAFIAGEAFGSVPVEKDSDIYQVFDQDDWMRDDAQIRAAGSPAEFSGFGITNSNTYTCKRYDLAKKIPQDIRDNADPGVNLDRLTTRWLTKQLLIRRERLFSSNFFVTGKWTSESTPSTLWDASLGKPVNDFDTARRTILVNTGFEPNKMVVGYDVHLALKKNAQVIDRVKYVAGNSFNLAVAPGKVAVQVMAEMFEVDKYLVAKGVYTASIEGDSTPTYSFIQGKHALMMYTEPEPAIMSPSAGYLFRSRKFGGNNEGLRVKKYWSDELESDIIEVAFKEDMKQVCNLCGYFFLSAVS